MKTLLDHTSVFSKIQTLIILSFLLIFMACKKDPPKDKVQAINTSISKEFKTIYWTIKAVHPEGKFLDVKAIDGYGNTYDIKGIQDANQTSLMDINAFVGDKQIPVKLLVNDGKLTPVKAIAKDGTLYNIYAIASNGDRLNIKGIERAGNIVHIKAIAKDGTYYGVKAVSPTGALNDVKGLKTSKEDLEYTLYGAKVYAHIKALPQVGSAGDNFLWHIVAIHPKGYTLEVKAIDKDGNTYPVKGIRDANQCCFLDIKAFVGDINQLPIKLLASEEANKPIKAIGNDGSLYDIMAFDPNGDKFDIKGIGRSGNIIHVKAINKEGKFYGVKALSADGQLNDVKGVKMFKIPVESKLNGVAIYAHLKALPQSK